jgi:hypothetical protein
MPQRNGNRLSTTALHQFLLIVAAFCIPASIELIMDDLQVLAGVNGPTSDTGSGKGSKPWSEAEIQALVHFLHQHRSQSSGGNFKPSIWNALVVELNKTFHTSRTTPAVKSKYGIVRLFPFFTVSHCFFYHFSPFFYS